MHGKVNAMWDPRKTLIFVLVGITGLLGGCSFVNRDVSESERGPFMRLMEADLHTYSHEHNKCFPTGKNQWDALAKLYPRYSAGFELAGLSGNIRQVTNALHLGLSLSNLTSWHYVTDLRSDDPPQLAILWESKPGISWEGKSSLNGERLVLLIGGDITNVSLVNWNGFLKEQEILRKAASLKHPCKGGNP